MYNYILLIFQFRVMGGLELIPAVTAGGTVHLRRVTGLARRDNQHQSPVNSYDQFRIVYVNLTCKEAGVRPKWYMKRSQLASGFEPKTLFLSG